MAAAVITPNHSTRPCAAPPEDILEMPVMWQLSICLAAGRQKRARSVTLAKRGSP